MTFPVLLDRPAQRDRLSPLQDVVFREHAELGPRLFGMAGGLGGVCLTAGRGAIKQSSGDYQLGLWLFASLGVRAWVGLYGVKSRWRTTWGSAAVTAARV